LDRYGLVQPRRVRRYKPRETLLSPTLEPNGLWCADYKGEFMLGNKSYCYPLTTTDFSCRFLLACDALKKHINPTRIPIAKKESIRWLENKHKSEGKKDLSYYLMKLARLGGYLARASDPPPGNTVIWRGLSRLTDISLGFNLEVKIVDN
jgi:hypothetical protein